MDKIFIRIKFAILVITVFGQVLFLNAVDINSAIEGKCFEIKISAKPDMNWLASMKRVYYSVMSRYDIYAMAEEIGDIDAKDLREDQIYYDSCIVYDAAPGGFWGRGFGGKKLFYNISLYNPNSFEFFNFTSASPKGTGGGDCRVTLTDNRTFMTNACCTGTNVMTWGIMAAIPKLPEETSKLIYDHMESLGFKREYFTGLRYDLCDLDKLTSN